MIRIRPLKTDEIALAVDLKIRCWQEELAGKAEDTLSFQEELDFFTEWAKSEKEYNDRRILLGAFDDEVFVGAAFGSFAEESDGVNDMELNGLWLEEEHRGKGISLFLLKALIAPFMDLGKEAMIVYNHHYAPSNAYYRRLHGEVLRQDWQLDGKLLIDVFGISLHELSKDIEIKLKKYQNQ